MHSRWVKEVMACITFGLTDALCEVCVSGVFLEVSGEFCWQTPPKSPAL